ncbi:CbtA family protein [Microvirga brassicacearum]|uniref:CbtA family protein n=1 Tax=Microvirga brassicacearum TaxID=2580413 RepID=A0A5N3P6L6_9HYPH|nr:CbtA family protein [Microvirga brassicacearum]KAB0265370.1 CbtA family protein [Microvirga brassicacearum]
MSLFRNIVFVSALAGLVAGLAMTGMQYAGTVPLILQAETYENAAPAAHDHGPAVQTSDGAAVAAHSHAHDEEAWAPADGFERSAFTALANIVTAIGFAILLVTASEFAGGLAGWRQGVFWGLAGFAVFTLAPGLGLPPELPGMPAADLEARQVWWVATAAATAAGLALLAFTRALPLGVLAVALIVVPHLVGAPKPASFDTAVPETLAHDFVVMASMVSLVFWVLLGGAAGFIRSRFMQPA